MADESTIQQGDIHWVDLGIPVDSEPGYRRPCIVVQTDLLNLGQIRTVIVCILTSNLRRAADLGNVLLTPGEAQLPQQSVANVSQLRTVSKGVLDTKIGTLSARRIGQIITGIHLVLQPGSADAGSIANK